ARAANETAYAGNVQQGQVNYLYDCVSEQAIRLGPRAGMRRQPWHDAVGKAVLAHRDPEHVLYELQQARGAGRSGLRGAAQWQGELAQVRARGYAVEEEAEAGVVVVAAALLGAVDEVSAALAVGGPAARLTPARIEQLGQLVVRQATEAAAELGWLSTRGHTLQRG